MADEAQVPYDRVTPSLERTEEKSCRRGAPWRLGLTSKDVDDTDNEWSSTNVEWMTQGELIDLWQLIGRTLNLAGMGDEPKQLKAVCPECQQEVQCYPDGRAVMHALPGWPIECRGSGEVIR